MKRRTAITVTIVAFVVAAGVDVALNEVHYFPGYAATIGLVGCIVIVLASKWLGKAFIQRPEDFYPDDIPDDEQEDLRG